MASGKTTLVGKLSQALEVPMIDLDELICSVAGMEVSDIFEKKGESYFRSLEASCLRACEQLKGSSFLVACGGGTPCFHQNLDWMHQHGTSILIDTPLSVIQSRLAKKAAARPLVAQKQAHAREQYIQALWEKRRACYLRAEHIFTDPLAVETGVQPILASI